MTLEQTDRSIGLIERGEVENPNGFDQRFTQALLLPPIQGILHDGDWRPNFVDALSRVDQVCREKEVCGHGMDHMRTVAKNAFTLRDSTVEAIRVGTMQTEEGWETLFSDASVLFPVLIHDLGYGAEDALWEDGYVHEHHTVGSKVVDFSSTSDSLVSQFRTPYLRSITNHTNAYASSIEAVYKAEGTVQPSLLFPLLVMTADKLDYFRSGRVAGLVPPDRYRDNPYFFLADAVEEYTVSFHDGSLLYEPTIKEGYYVPERNGAVLLDFPTWQTEVQSRFPHVFSIGSTFAGVLGGTFAVQEAA